LKLTILTVVLTSAALLASSGVVDAHEGEDHGTPEPVVSVQGEGLLAAAGSGAVFDAVLKYPPFGKGERVSVVLYLVSSETNRPVADATVIANLSEGDKSTTVAFQPNAGGPVGAYSATISPGSAVAMSWLFDVTAGSDSDLIAISGFKAGDNAVGKQAGAHHSHDSGPPQVAVLIALGSLLVIGAFAAGRLTARKGGAA
jgi:hypothetical protein